MSVLCQLEAVPAYYAVDKKNRSVPFIVALLLHDGDGRQRIPPAVELAIDRTVEITGRHGLVTAIVCERDTRRSVSVFVERAMGIEGAILLFRCQSAETAEALMRCMDESYTLSLVRRQGREC